MVLTTFVNTAALAALLLALPASAAGLYPKSSAVLQVDAKNYDRLIAKSNHTSIVEFYAPWCGHCKNLQPAYENAAKRLAGLAKVAAVNCDEEDNKAFCGGMGVKGFPTLKIVKPGKKNGSPVVEDYNGPREAKDIYDAVTGKIPNHVKRIADKDLEGFLAEANDTAKAILFTEKGTTSPLLKAIAVDFLGSITVAQIRSKEAASVSLFGIEKFPTILLLPGGKETDGILYDGEMKKDPIVKFLSQISPANPDPAPPKAKLPKDSKTKDKKKDTKKPNPKAESAASAAKESFASASESQEKSEASASAASVTTQTLEQNTPPTESPNPIVELESAPVIIPEAIPAPPVPTLDVEALATTCLGDRAGTCVLAFIPSAHEDDVQANIALHSLAEIAHKHSQAGRKLFPFYVIPSDNPASSEVKKGLGLTQDVEIIAVNRKRGWWRHFVAGSKDGSGVQADEIEIWIDAIRMGEGAKQNLPDLFMPDKVASEAAGEQPVGQKPVVANDTVEEPEPVPESTAETVAEDAEPVTPPTPEPEVHDEL